AIHTYGQVSTCLVETKLNIRQAAKHIGGLSERPKFDGGPITMTPNTPRPLLAGTIATLALVVTAAWVTHSYRQGDAAASVAPAALPQVVVSKPLEREVDSRLGFLGQFSAVEQVELRAQVGGTLTGIHFKDGDIVHQGDLLFTIDPRPYEIRLA